MSVKSLSILVLLASLALFSNVSHCYPRSFDLDQELLMNGDKFPYFIIPPQSLPNRRFDRQLSFHQRPSRNSWFKVSTYQQMKPSSVDSDEKSSGDHLLRWG